MFFINSLIIAFIFFVSSMIVHITIWKNHRFKSPWLPLVLLFALFPIFLILLYHFSTSFLSIFPNAPIISTFEWLSAYLLHGALSMGYSFLYPTAQNGSPAVRLSLYLDAHMPDGKTENEVFDYLQSRDDLNPRINDLISSNFLSISQDGKLKITLLGRIFTTLNRVISQFLCLDYFEG
jgi:amino acid permease